ncbi:MAG: polymer-forming cytoskeletal protein [Marinicellaceae bacterium]
MFNNKDNNNNDSTSISSSTSSKLDTMLGQNTRINGDIVFKGVLNLDGKVTGSLIGENGDDVLMITESGVVEGKIEVANLIINGTVKGDIKSTGKIEVASKADIEGNVYYQNIEMETGSKINGQLIYQDAEKPKNITKIDEKKSK